MGCDKAEHRQSRTHPEEKDRLDQTTQQLTGEFHELDYAESMKFGLFVDHSLFYSLLACNMPIKIFQLIAVRSIAQ